MRFFTERRIFFAYMVKKVLPLWRKLCGEKIAMTPIDCITVLKSSAYVNNENSISHD